MFELANHDKVGIWLGGVIFSPEDWYLTAILIRLYQLGLEDTLWQDGTRPHLAMYVKQAFNRSSVLTATHWKDHEDDIVYFEQESQDIKKARYACYAAVALAGVYVAKKVFKF